MKHIYITLALLISAISFGQIPAGYYSTATGTGFTLKTQLKTIVTNGHTARDYDQLLDGNGIPNSQGYVDTHSDVDVLGGTNYENDGSVLDFYSENPDGNDPYNFIHNVDDGGNQTAEGDCYNREHLVPQSSFGSQYPMQADIHHVIPTDCRVNNFRGSYPFGNVATTDFTSMNGSKRGSSAMNGYSGIVFEPIDEFKGDIARAFLYFATRYEDTVDGYTSFDMFNGTEDEVFFPWAIEVLLDWHNNVDPVDNRERERNNATYIFQGNRNPFVDHPEYANMVWNPTPDTEVPSTPINLVVTNEASTSISLAWTASTDNVAVTSYDVYMNGIFEMNVTTNSATVINLTPETTYSFTVIAKDAAMNESDESAAVEGTTTEAGQSGTECGAETFENIPANASNYDTRTWTGDNGATWTATDARTDQTITNRAITTRGSITIPTTAGGIGSFTVTTKRVFGGSAGTFNLSVNGTIVGTIAYGNQDEVQIITIPNINVENNVSIVIDGNSTVSNRVAFDDITWTCYTSLSADEFDMSSIKIYPNPVKNQLHINLNNSFETTVEIYNVLGRKMLNQTILNSEIISTENLSSGVYILKLTQGNNSITKKLIKN